MCSPYAVYGVTHLRFTSHTSSQLCVSVRVCVSSQSQDCVTNWCPFSLKEFKTLSHAADNEISMRAMVAALSLLEDVLTLKEE